MAIRKNAAKIDRSSLGLRDALFDEFDALRRGESTAQRATAASRLASQIITSAKLDLDYKRFIGEDGTKKIGSDPLKALA